MRRPVGVTVAAVVLGLLTLWGIFTVLISAITPFLIHNPAVPKATPPGFHVFMVAFGLFSICFFIFCAWTVVALFRMRTWARYSMIVLGALTALSWGSLSALMIICVRRFAPALHAAPAGSPNFSAGAVLMVLGLFFAAPALIGIWWVVYFSLRHVRVAFAGVQSQSQDTTLPAANNSEPWLVVVTVFACLMLVGGVMVFGGTIVLAAAGLPVPLFLFGIFFHGKGALAGMLFLGAFEILAGIALLRRMRAGYWAGLAWQIFCLISFALMLTPGYRAKLSSAGNEMTRRFSLVPQHAQAAAHAQVVAFQRHLLFGCGILGFAMSLVFLYALLRCQRRFLTRDVGNLPAMP